MAEGGSRTDALYRNRANRALADINSRVGHFESHWNNDSTDETYGTLTLSGREVIFPGDLIDLTSARWNGRKMEEPGSEALLDEYDPYWRTTTGTPTAFVRNARGLTLNREYASDADGLLIVYGLGSIPLFDPASAVNPLEYVPDIHHMLIADYMIATLPIELREKTDAQIAAMQLMRAEAKERWHDGLESCVTDLIKRKLPARTGD